jgi:hypothetical protein
MSSPIKLRIVNPQLPQESVKPPVKTLKIRIVNHPKEPWHEPQKLPILPKTKDRVLDSWYLYNKNPVRWDGKRLRCQHDQVQSVCKECGGSQICEHNRRRHVCRDCKGSQICEHNKVRNKCRDCGGGSICEHNRDRSVCRNCKGSQICEHNKVRSVCRDCKGGHICEHNKVRSRCRDCGGSSICEHNRDRSICRDCKGSQICEHDKERRRCKECFTHPQFFCQICTNVHVTKGSRTYPLCFRCHCLTHPEEKLPTRFKMKEHHILDSLCSYCPDYDFIHDKRIEGGCSKRRPDLMLDCLTHSIVVEIDEDQHTDYKCEEKRMMQIFTDLGDRPLVILRFNPDKYSDAQGQRVPALFSFGSDNLIVIDDPEQLDQRVQGLAVRIRYHAENLPLKELTVERLYYDK